MLDKLTKKGITVLITVDEATNNQYMKTFAHTFQGFLRSKFNVFLLMTGLYQNVQALQNQKTLTFLYRSKKITLSPLSLVAIADSYEKNLLMEHKESIKAAKATMGMPLLIKFWAIYFMKSQKESSLPRCFQITIYIFRNLFTKKSIRSCRKEALIFLAQLKTLRRQASLRRTFSKTMANIVFIVKALSIAEFLMDRRGAKYLLPCHVLTYFYKIWKNFMDSKTF